MKKVRARMYIASVLGILILMLVGIGTASADPAITPIYDIQFTTDSGGDSPYLGQTVTTEGIVTAFFYDGGNKYTFIQDGSGPWSGLMLFRPDGYINVGDEIQVTGEISEYYGMTEIAFGNVVTVSSGNLVPDAEVLGTGDVSEEQWESVFVRVEDVSVTDDSLGFGEWLVDDGSGEVVIDDLGSYAYSPTNGDLLEYIQGPLNYSYSAFKIEPRDDNDLSVFIPPPPVLTIMQIQGDAQFSPYEGQVVETSGVVTLFTANGNNCWLQDPTGDSDAGTSDGIFVSGCAFPDEGSPPSVGDQIRIIAKVEEQQFGDALPLTRLRNVELIELESKENPLPAPVEIMDLPDVSIGDAIEFWEPLEGMLVVVENAPVVAATSRFGEFAILTKTDAKPGSGFYPQEQQILLRSLGEGLVDYNPERILVDDSSLDTAIQVMPGDRMRRLVGVVDYTFGNYKLQPVEYDEKTHKLPNLPASDRSGGPGNVAITTFNVQNLFDLQLNVSQEVDVIGQIGFDPGSEWGSGDTSTQNNTIRRISSVCNGDPVGSDVFDPSVEWEGFANNTFDGLGSHTTDCVLVEGLFISEYVEGSSLNKAVEIYNGTGSSVNLGAEGYTLEIYFNGQTSPGTTIELSGTIADGDVFVVADDGADPVILAVTDQTSNRNFFNGDDAVVLSKGGKDDASSTPTADELEIQLAKLALAIQVELELPEIIVVQEIENEAIAQELADRVNAAAGTDYVATSFETSDGRGIEPGFLWDADRVELVEAYQLSGPDVEAAFGPSSASPGREPIYGMFEVNGETIHIVGNHFKSKGGDAPIFGIDSLNGLPFDRVTEAQRKLQAQVVRSFVNSLFAAEPDALVMVTGDLNDFQFGEPGEGSDHPLAILEGSGGEVPLYNLIYEEKDAERYTFVFDGNSQVLDHMLVSPELLDMLQAADVLHFNAGYPNALGDNVSTTLRASDHDPLEARFKIK